MLGVKMEKKKKREKKKKKNRSEAGIEHTHKHTHSEQRNNKIGQKKYKANRKIELLIEKSELRLNRTDKI